MVTVELPRLTRTGQRKGRLRAANCSETVWKPHAIWLECSKKCLGRDARRYGKI